MIDHRSTMNPENDCAAPQLTTIHHKVSSGEDSKTVLNIDTLLGHYDAITPSG